MPDIQIGTMFMSYGKHKKECIVTDIYKTYNNSGELVKKTYVATHDFCGQIITEYDIPESTIRRNIITIEQ